MNHLISNLHINVPLPRIDRSGGGWALFNDHVDDFAWAQGMFNNDELDAIINIGNAYSLDQATTFGGANLDIRNSKVAFLFPGQHTDWIFSRLTDAINATNSQFFKFDLTALEQGLQFTRYEAPGEHYDWHIDRGMGVGCRKLSVSIQLSDPNAYVGGDLELKFGGDSKVMARERGLATFFPSYVLHRVSPVTEGTRYSLVAWISGPPFK